MALASGWPPAELKRCTPAELAWIEYHLRKTHYEGKHRE